MSHSSADGLAMGRPPQRKTESHRAKSALSGTSFGLCGQKAKRALLPPQRRPSANLSPCRRPAWARNDPTGGLGISSSSRLVHPRNLDWDTWAGDRRPKKKKNRFDPISFSRAPCRLLERVWNRSLLVNFARSPAQRACNLFSEINEAPKKRASAFWRHLPPGRMGRKHARRSSPFSFEYAKRPRVHGA